MNLLMMAPLLDSRGQLRYFLGAQVDISGLVKDSTELDAFQHMLDKQDGRVPKDEPKDELQELSEMFNNSELEIVRKFGGSMHREHVEEQDDGASIMHRPRLLIKDTNSFDVEKALEVPAKPEGRLLGVYKHVSTPLPLTFYNSRVRTYTYLSTYSSAQPRLSASFSPPPPFAFQESFSPASSTASEAPPASATP
jgi:hypothetical protein